MFIFWVAKGGFNKKYLYTDNIGLSVASSLINIGIYGYDNSFMVNDSICVRFYCIGVVCYIILLPVFP